MRSPTIRATTRLLTLALISLAPPAGRADAPPGWAPELAPAFALYDDGQWDATQTLCQQIAGAARSERLRHDAEALAALALLRSDVRDARLEGRGLIAQLSAREPSLLDRPEVLLAGGVACTKMDETSDGLSMLTAAADGFAARGDAERLLAAYVSLAENWARFSEWERAPRHLRVPVPQSASEARRTRREQIERLVARAAELRLPEASGRVELVLARWLLDHADSTAEGLALLERLARDPAGATALEAGVLAARELERQGRWSDAAGMYERVVGASSDAPVASRRRAAEARARAAEALAALRAAAAELDVPDQAEPGAPLAIGIRARHVASLRVELRRVDLAHWLEQRRGNFAESALPESGSLVFTASVETAAARPFDWWDGPAGPPVRLEPGAYVLTAAGQDASGKTVRAKRLVLASSLRAVALVGRDRAALWAYASGRDDRAVRMVDGAELRFWMNGSFVPQRLLISAGALSFELPAERNVFRDRNWVALVTAGEELALLRGELPSKRQERDERTRVVLAGQSGVVARGELLRVAGLLYEARPSAGLDRSELTLELIDGDGQSRAAARVTPGPGGVFSAELPLGDAMTGLGLGVVVRRDQKVIENVRGRHVVQVAGGVDSRGESGVMLDLRGAELVSGDQPPVLSLSLQYPWGGEPGGRIASVVYRGLGPAATPGDWARAGPAHNRVLLDTRGRARILPPLTSLELPDGPAVYGAWATGSGWDYRSTSTEFKLLRRGANDGWIRAEQREPRVGLPLRFDVGLFAGGGVTSLLGGEIEIARDGSPVARLPLALDIHGWRSADWTPEHAGDHRLRLLLDGRPVVEQIITISNMTGSAGPSDWVDGSAAIVTEPSPALRLNLSGTYRGPLLAALVAGEPVAAHALDVHEPALAAHLPLATRPRNARVVLARPAVDGSAFWLGPEVRPDAADALRVDIAEAQRPPLPGQVMSLDVTCRNAAGDPVPAEFIARLVSLPADYGLPWIGGAQRLPIAPLAGDVRACRGWRPADVDDGPRDVPVPQELVTGMLAGATLWVETHAAPTGRATLEPRLPLVGRRFILCVLAVDESGEFALATRLVEVRDGFEVVADAPSIWSPGDRTLIAARVRCDSSATARVRVEGGPGLSVERVRARSGALVKDVADGWAEVTVSESEPATLTFMAEAVAPAPAGAFATLTIEGAGGTQVLRLPYRVESVPPVRDARGLEDSGPDSPAAVLRVTRVLSLLREPDPGERDPNDLMRSNRIPAPNWRQTPVAAGTRLAPGDLLLVREDIEVAAAFGEVSWVQAAPANAHVCLADLGAAQQIGRAGRPDPYGLEWTSPELPRGRWRNEYVLALMRPGSCSIPLPRVASDGQAVVVEGEATAVVVESR